MSIPPLVPALGAAPLTPGREASFQSFFFYTLLGAGMTVIVVIAAVWVYRAVRRIWRDGNRVTAAVMVGSATFFGILFLSLAHTALIGATHPPATPPPFRVQGPAQAVGGPG